MTREIPGVGLRTVPLEVAGGGEKKELGKRPSVGVLALIIGLDSRRNGDNISDPLIWAITELQGKPESEKRPGQTSVPAETKTVGENLRSNVLGVIAEFTDDRTLPLVAQHLYEVESSYRERKITVGPKDVADVAVFIYDGPLDVSFMPVCYEEVRPIGWIRKNQLNQREGMRSVLRQALDFDQREGVIRQAMEDFYANRGKRHVIPEQLKSLEEFIARRETSPDVSIATLPVREN